MFLSKYLPTSLWKILLKDLTSKRSLPSLRIQEWYEAEIYKNISRDE